MLSNREIIQNAFAALGNATTVAEKIAAVAYEIERVGTGADRVTTRMILRQLRMTGRA